MPSNQTAWASGLRVSAWAKELFREVEQLRYFKKFEGASANSMIQRKNELHAKKGKDVTFGLLLQPDGTGIVTNDDVLEGNEGALVTYAQTVTLAQKRVAYRNTGRFEDKRVLLDFRKEALDHTKIAIANNMDAEMFAALVASPTRTYRADDGGVAVYTRLNQASISGELVAADQITPADISALKTAALVPKGADEMAMRPIMIDGGRHYVLLIHPEQAYDLKRNPEWNQNAREAEVRGKSNPIFKGALGMHDNVIIHVNDQITTATTYGSGAIRGAIGLFMGAQAGVFASGGDAIWVEKSFDFTNQLAVAGGRIYVNAKSLFNSEDFAVIAYYTATTQFQA
ncbi:MAG: N4-gp56 family major capsid protein [Candidatus Omnitrophica bacterium]|nr:N4-gp56 family major capsid protein [Candidatus Omnitrophota bacterium]